MTAGLVSVSILAGHIAAVDQPPHEKIGQQIRMGDNLYFHITADIARQWVGVLNTITEGNNK